MDKVLINWDKIIKMRISLRNDVLSHWKDYVFLSPNWWLVVIISIIFIIVWWKLVDKSRLVEILLYGVIIAYLTTALDALGVSLVTWGYPTMLEPTTMPLIPANLFGIAVVYMLIYQYFRTWKTFIISHIVVSAFFAFIFEPFLIWTNIYKPFKWKSIYSFPLYILIAVSIRFLMLKIIKKENSSKAKS